MTVASMRTGGREALSGKNAPKLQGKWYRRSNAIDMHVQRFITRASKLRQEVFPMDNARHAIAELPVACHRSS